MNCKNCGAPIRRNGYCGYCGSYRTNILNEKNNIPKTSYEEKLCKEIYELNYKLSELIFDKSKMARTMCFVIRNNIKEREFALLNYTECTT